MRVLIADDDAVLRRSLRRHLEQWSFEVVECSDGAQAWDALQQEHAPPLAVIDWEMPVIDGPTLCQKLRETPSLSGMYVILLTGNQERRHVVSGLESGADDYVTKPFDSDELRARLHIGSRIVTLQLALAARVAELQTALSSVRSLSGLLPICAYCKRIRDDQNYWQQMEQYLSERSEANFSHGICPECLAEHMPG